MNLQTILDKLVKDHSELQGGPYTWKAVQEGPLLLGVKAAVEEAYQAGFDDGVASKKVAPKK